MVDYNFGLSLQNPMQIRSKEALHITEAYYLNENPSDPNRPSEFETSLSVGTNRSQLIKKGIATYAIDYAYVGNGFTMGTEISFLSSSLDEFWVLGATYTIVLRNKKDLDNLNLDYVSVLSNETKSNETAIIFKLIKIPSSETKLFSLNLAEMKTGSSQADYNSFVASANDLMAIGNDHLSTRTVLKLKRNESYILLDGGETTVYVNIDDSLTLEEILANIDAEDLFGQKVQVKAESNNYDFTKLGKYDISVLATDDFGQTSHATIHVIIKDYVAPVINTQSVSFECSDKITVESFTAELSSSDNYFNEEDIIYEIVSASNNLRWNEINKCGDYSIVVRAQDPGDLWSEKAILLHVVDNIPPVIKDLSGKIPLEPIRVGITALNRPVQEVINSLFYAEDNCDNNLNIDIKTGVLEKKIGVYNLVLIATDLSGNTGECHVTFNVIGDALPVFLLDPLFAVASVDNPLSPENIKGLIRNSIPENATHLLIEESDLEDFYQTRHEIGEHKIRFSYHDSAGLKSSWLTVRVTGQVKHSVLGAVASSWSVLFTDISSMTKENWLLVLLTCVVAISSGAVSFFSFKAMRDFLLKKMKKTTEDGDEYLTDKNFPVSQSKAEKSKNEVIDISEEDYLLK